MDDRFFTLNEVAKYLKIPKSTLYKLSEKGQIPSVKIGKQLRFRKSSLNHWLAEKEKQGKEFTPNQLLTKRVLLIDDDALVLNTLSRFLKNSGYAVELAQSGEEALEKAQNQQFDLVIADIRMPGINGIETIKRLRQINQRYQRTAIPEIMITGYMDTQAEKEAANLGINDYLYKPFAINDFLERVRKKAALN